MKLTFQELVEKGFMFDASGIDNPYEHIWAKGLLNDVYYPFDTADVSKDNTPPIIDLDNEETYIKSVETHQTGGNIYNDVITLKDGIVIRISEGGLSVYRNAKDDDNNEELTFVEFPVTD